MTRLVNGMARSAAPWALPLDQQPRAAGCRRSPADPLGDGVEGGRARTIIGRRRSGSRSGSPGFLEPPAHRVAGLLGEVRGGSRNLPDRSGVDTTQTSPAVLLGEGPTSPYRHPGRRGPADHHVQLRGSPRGSLPVIMAHAHGIRQVRRDLPTRCNPFVSVSTTSDSTSWASGRPANLRRSQPVALQQHFARPAPHRPPVAQAAGPGRRSGVRGAPAAGRANPTGSSRSVGLHREARPRPSSTAAAAPVQVHIGPVPKLLQ